jgi:hypothetical protein
MDVIAEAISSEHEREVAGEIGFHLGDWQSDAAFIVALHLFRSGLRLKRFATASKRS